MSFSSESDWSSDEVDADLIDDVPNQLFVAMLTEPPQMHRSRVTARGPAAPGPRMVKIPVAPCATEVTPHSAESHTLPSPDAASASTAVSQAREDEAETVPALSRKRARVPLEEKLRSALRTEPSDSVDEDAVAAVVDRIAAAVRGCGDDAGLVASLIVNGLSDPLNQVLRNDVLSGHMAAAKLVTLNDEDFLNPQRREELHAQRQERMEQRSVDYVERLTMPITTFFTCPACGCQECFANFRNTDFVKWQGDDPNPTLLTCTKCSLAFKA